MDLNKLTEFNCIVGKTIENYGDSGYKEVWIKFTDGSTLTIVASDDHCGCNDSWAEFSEANSLSSIVFRTITTVEDGEIEPDHTVFTIWCGDVSASFHLIHEQNGYYGYSYNFYLTD